MCGCCDAVADAGDGDGSVSNLGSGRGGSFRDSLQQPTVCGSQVRDVQVRGAGGRVASLPDCGYRCRAMITAL